MHDGANLFLHLSLVTPGGHARFHEAHFVTTLKISWKFYIAFVNKSFPFYCVGIAMVGIIMPPPPPGPMFVSIFPRLLYGVFEIRPRIVNHITPSKRNVPFLHSPHPEIIPVARNIVLRISPQVASGVIELARPLYFALFVASVSPSELINMRRPSIAISRCSNFAIL